MALQRRIQEIHIKNQDGGGSNLLVWRYRLTPNNFDNNLGMVNWGSAFDEALDGSLRQNFRGFRSTINIDWEKLTDATIYETEDAANSDLESLFNDMITSLATNKDDGVDISLDGVNGNYDTYVPESLSRLASYTNQIGRTSGDLSFKGQQLKTSIPSYLKGPTA